MQVGQHFHVHRDHCRACLHERLYIEVRIRDHQMDIERYAGHPLDRFHHRRADGDVRHEVAVHHVHVNQIGTAAFGGRDGLAEHGKVGRQNRGRDEHAHRLTSREIGSPGAIRNPP